MRENFEKVPGVLYPINQGASSVNLPVYRSDLSGVMFAYDGDAKVKHTIADEKQLIRATDTSLES